MHDRATDSELMRAVRDGDLACLGQLFERHHEKVFALAMRMSGSADAADDLVQETFLRILRYRESFRGDARFTTWMYRLARNVCVDHLRASGADEVARERWARDASHQVARDQGAHDRLAVLEEALRRLPIEKREVLILSRFHDLRFDEIADVLECRPGTVRVRAHRALQELRKLCRELERRDHELRSGFDAPR